MDSGAQNRGCMPMAAAVATVLRPVERMRVDAAGQGLYRAVHRETLDDAIRDVKQERVRAVLVSVACCDSYAMTRVAALVREYPQVSAVALLCEEELRTPQTVLALGHSGIETLIDVRRSSGWRELRTALLSSPPDDLQRLALSQIATDLTGASEECRRFFRLLFTIPSRVATVRALARQLEVVPSTLMSRFFRARLPAPKRYLAVARLTRAAYLFQSSGLSVADVSNRLDYSSPQSFGRHVRRLLGLSASRFRECYDGAGMLERFRGELVIPYLGVLREFRPLSAPPGWTPSARASTESRADHHA
ncbi:MAG: hypothetical protein NVS4B3_03950 [Gemmatimonadaceae bacterium]